MHSAVRRLGRWSAWSMVGIGAGYAVALVVGFARYGLRAPITDPLLGVMEALTLLSAPVLLVLMASLRDGAPPERRLYGTLAFGFAMPFATLTAGVHFVELTALRQLGHASMVWPSVPYALELLAWDGFLGLALVCAGASVARTSTLRGEQQDIGVRRGLLLAGMLCLAGLAGPASGRMRWQVVGIVGYAVVLPVVCYRVARRFGDAGRDDHPLI